MILICDNSTDVVIVLIVVNAYWYLCVLDVESEMFDKAIDGNEADINGCRPIFVCSTENWLIDASTVDFDSKPVLWDNAEVAALEITPCSGVDLLKASEFSVWLALCEKAFNDSDFDA